MTNACGQGSSRAGTQVLLAQEEKPGLQAGYWQGWLSVGCCQRAGLKFAVPRSSAALKYAQSSIPVQRGRYWPAGGFQELEHSTTTSWGSW